MTKKVLHVLGSLNAGGVESWLVTLLRNTNSNKIKHEFVLQKSGPGFYDNEVLSLDSRIHYCKLTSNLFLYSINLYRSFRFIQPDVVHSHVHAFSGLVLFIAYVAGVKHRISHAHSDTRVNEQSNSLSRKFYSKLMRLSISKLSTAQIAVSSNAAEDLYGIGWKKNKKCVLMPCGIDYKKYNSKYRDVKLRQKMGIPEDAFVIGHVGRFDKPKNHSFLIDVFNDIRKKNTNAYLILVGDGQLKKNIESKVTELELSPYVIFTGLRKDVPTIMLSVFDIFAFPSLWEGLGLVAVEAQMAGLKVISSTAVPKETDCGGIQYLDLNKNDWALGLLSHNVNNSLVKPNNFSKFSITSNINLLKNIYSEPVC